jgi:hypothetical protein
LVARNAWGDRQPRGDPNTWQWGLLGTLVPQDFSTPLPNAALQGPWEECRRLVGMHIIWPDIFVNVCSVVLRWIIVQVVLTGLIIKPEIFMCFSIQ